MKRVLSFTLILLAVAYTCEAQTVAEVRTYGGPFYDEGRQIIETDDGGYLIVGTTASTDLGNSDIYVIKINEDLTLDWSRLLGGSASEQGRSVCLTNSGDYLVLGQTAAGQNGGYDAVVYRLTPTGETVWERHYGTADWDLATRIVKGVNQYYIAGTTYGFSPGDSRMWLFRINDDGDVVSETTYDVLPRAEATDLFWYDHALYMTGTRTYDGGSSQAVLRKLNPAGSILWEHVQDSSEFQGRAVHVSTFGVAVAFAKRNAQQEDTWDAFLMRFNTNGEQIAFNWLKSPFAGNQIPRAITWAGDQMLFAAKTDIFGAGGLGSFTCQLTEFAAYLESTTFGGSEDEEPFSIVRDSQGRIVVVGYTNSYGGANAFPDVYLVRIPNRTIVPNFQLDLDFFADDDVFTGVDDHVESTRRKPWPNPAAGRINLNESTRWWVLRDPAGRMVDHGTSVVIDVSVKAPGLYLLEAQDHQGRYTERIIVL